MDKIEFTNGGIEMLDVVESLWEKLNKQHENLSTYFQSQFRENKFENRKSKFLSKDTIAINIDLIKRNELYIGYCISTINKNAVGEIDSLFIEEEYRKLGLGGKLITRGLEWLNSNNVKAKVVAVAEGNENVLEFYKKYNFYKRSVILQENL